MPDSKRAIGTVASILGAVFLAGCRTNAQGLGERDGQAPPPQVGRQDAAPGPVSGPVADAGGPAPVTPQTPPPRAPQTDTAPVAADAAPIAADAPVPPPDQPRPLADAAAAEAAGPPPTWLGPDVRAKEIQADTVRARIIYAKEIDADEAMLETLIETKDDKRWEMGGADTKISVHTLMAETIYVEKLHCRRVEARQLYAEVVKIKRR